MDFSNGKYVVIFIDRNELKIQFRKDEATNSFVLEMKLPGAESIDSGIDTPL